MHLNPTQCSLKNVSPCAENGKDRLNYYRSSTSAGFWTPQKDVAPLKQSQRDFEQLLDWTSKLLLSWSLETEREQPGQWQRSSVSKLVWQYLTVLHLIVTKDQRISDWTWKERRVYIFVPEANIVVEKSRIVHAASSSDSLQTFVLHWSVFKSHISRYIFEGTASRSCLTLLTLWFIQPDDQKHPTVTDRTYIKSDILWYLCGTYAELVRIRR